MDTDLVQEHYLSEFDNYPELTFEIELVGPAEAKIFLKANTRNRTLKSSEIRRYADDILRGDWECTGESVKISDAGRLLDGQNRLHAVIKSGMSVPMLICRGVPDKAQDAMDSGAKRSAGDSLGLDGMTNANVAAAAAKFALCVNDDDTHVSRSISTSAIKAFYASNPDMVKSVEFACKLHKNRAACGATLIAYTHWRLSAVSAVDADKFWLAAVEKVGLTLDDPTIALMDRFIDAKRQREILPKDVQLSLVYRAWNTRRLGKTMRTLRINSASGGFIPVPTPR